MDFGEGSKIPYLGSAGGGEIFSSQHVKSVVFKVFFDESMKNYLPAKKIAPLTKILANLGVKIYFFEHFGEGGGGGARARLAHT